MVGGGRPLVPEICAKQTSSFKNANFQSLFAYNASAVTASENVHH